MNSNKTYYIFVSHAWDYSRHYEKIVEFLNSDTTFKWRNYSIPMNDPVHTNGTDKDLRAKIDNQIKLSSVIILIGGVYASYRKWIDAEIDIAQSYNKPIITVKLWDSERSSDRAQLVAKEIVAWQSKSIIEAIKKHG